MNPALERAAITPAAPDPLDFYDDDWTDAVVAVGKELPDRDHDHDPALRTSIPAKRTRREIPTSKIKALAQRLRRAKS